jgi:putative sterol carrier protein
MLEKIFNELPGLFQQEKVSASVSYYFSLGDVKKTVQISPTGCIVEDGKTVDNADCVCKTSAEFFTKIWDDGYRPGLKDFMSGTIKSNKPDELKTFLKAFGKDS